MNYTVTMLEQHHLDVLAAIFSDPELEGAAYLLCGTSVTPNETRLLVRDVVPVQARHYLVREPLRMSIDSASYTAVAKRAAAEKAAIVFVHSHPNGYPEHSPQDDREEPKLLDFFAARVPGVVHGSLVFSENYRATGRVFLDGDWKRISRVRVLGNRFRFLDHHVERTAVPEFFERNVRAFGQDIQRLLQRLHIGVVGGGGTGSPTVEQLVRLGVGTLSVFDGDTLADSNLSRVYTGSVADVGRNKAELAAELAHWIGLGTRVVVHPRHITEEQTAKALRDCDLVFACTDKVWCSPGFRTGQAANFSRNSFGVR